MPDGGAGPAVLETIPAADIVASWRRDFGIDVGALFDGIPALRLCWDPRRALIYFDPPVSGTPDFYAALRRFGWYHPAAKAEHAAAGREIGPDDRVLDIGAGTGDFADHVNGAAYEGIETDPGSVARARAFGRNVVHRPLQPAAVGRGAHSVVTAFQVLEHVPDPDAFLDGALSHLAPGGRLILGTPDAAGYIAGLPDFVLNAPPHHLTWWTEDALGRLLVRHGLEAATFGRFAVEAWERRLWWMARTARLFGRPGRARHFGRGLKRLKTLSWLASGLLQPLPPPAGAKGATLLAIARKPDRR